MIKNSKFVWFLQYNNIKNNQYQTLKKKKINNKTMCNRFYLKCTCRGTKVTLKFNLKNSKNIQDVSFKTSTLMATV